MSKGIFITATGTDIGKTYVTALVIKKLTDSGINACYYKAALSGAEEKNGVLIPGDAEHVKSVSGVKQELNDMVSYVYKTAVSPHLAAQIEGVPPEMKKIKNDFYKLAERYDYITVEGSGGIVCPIRMDTEKIMLEDIVRELSLPTLVVADAGLGTINSVVLTYEYLTGKNIPVKGIILNNYDDGSLMHRDNRLMIEKLTRVPIAACVKSGDNELDIDISRLTALYDEVK